MSRVTRNSRQSWLSGYLARYKGDVARALGLGLAASACAALLMFTSGYLISATALTATTLFSILVPVAFVQLFGFGRPLARYLERLASHNWVLRVTSDLRLALFRGINRRSEDPSKQRAAGEYLELLSDDVGHLQNLYLRVVFPTAIAYGLAIGASVLFGFFSISFSLLTLASFVIVAICVPYSALLATRALAEQAKALQSEEVACVTDDLFGSVDWALSGRSCEAASSHAHADKQARSLEAKLRMRQRAFSLASSVLLGLMACAIIAWSGSSFSQEAGSVNWIAAFALGFFPLIESFSVLPTALSDSTAHRAAIARLGDYVADEANHEQNDDVLEERDLAPLPADGAYSIEISGVSYTYPEASRPVLDGIDMRIRQGARVAVLGRSGAGKSTLAKLICGFMEPDKGSICLKNPQDDKANGLTVGYLGQNPYLFNRSLRANLLIGAPDANDEALVGALSSVGLSRKLELLPDGLDTIIGQTGVGFSGGEAHRVALARVLLTQAPIVVVDEPFSALDPETEKALLQTMLNVCSGKTLIVITHHLAQIDEFDRVVFIEDGHIDIDGSPAELAASSARFAHLLEFDRSL